MGKNKPIIGFILGIIVAVVIFFANIPGLERTGQMCMAFSVSDHRRLSYCGGGERIRFR